MPSRIRSKRACVTGWLAASLTVTLAAPATHASTMKTIFMFKTHIGDYPTGALIDVDDALWGVALDGGNGRDGGTVFKVPLDGSAATALPFYGSYGPNHKRGHVPMFGLARRGPSLYGVTAVGGDNGTGTIFQIDAAGKKLEIYSFPAGGEPSSQMTNVDGILYGTVAAIDSSSQGYVYKLTHDNQVSILYSFATSPGNTDGNNPTGRLLYVHGLLYGTTEGGGASGVGTVYTVTLQGQEKVLHSFKANKDGQIPQGGLVYMDGRFFGTTYTGSQPEHYRRGTVFSLTKSGHEAVLYAFGSTANDCTKPGGATPTELTKFNGSLWGVTRYGGASDEGCLYSITSTGAETIQYSFNGTNELDGAYPDGTLTVIGNSLYGGRIIRRRKKPGHAFCIYALKSLFR